MTKGAKLAIILGIGLLTAGLGYYFMIYRPAHPKPPKNDPPPPPSGSGTGSGLGGPISTSVIGKTAYASQNGVKVLFADGTTRKTASKDEWLGVIEAKVTKGGQPFYQVSGGFFVSTGLVKIG